MSVTLRSLREAPKHFELAARGLTDAQLHRRPDEGSWSVHEVLAHLRGCADVRNAWIERMLAEDTPTIRYASPRTGMKKTHYEEHDFRSFLRAFARQRADLVRRLASLQPADWCRNAQFTGTTPGWTPDVHAVVRGLVTHEQAHFEQISAVAQAAR